MIPTYVFGEWASVTRAQPSRTGTERTHTQNRNLVRPNRVARRSAAAAGLTQQGLPSAVPGDGVVLFTVVRNEELRLPFFLEHYFRLGVAAVVAIDHRSTDATPDILDAHPRVIRYRTEQGFNLKAAWLDVLLRRYGLGRWCLVADADELVRYPRDHHLTLPELCSYMDEAGDTALQCLLLDMYGSGTFEDSNYVSGTDPLIACPFFDRGPYASSREWVPDDCYVEEELLNAAFYGGVRSRAFGMTRICISKYPLFRFCNEMYAATGCHFVEGVAPSRLRGSLLHYKFLQDFPQRTRAAVLEGQYAGRSADYRHYATALAHGDGIVFDAAVSTRFESTAQLLKNGIMCETAEFKRWIGQR